MEAISAEMVANLWLEEPAPHAVLLTITAEGVDDPICVTDDDGDLGKDYGGIVSNGVEYAYVPFSFAWVGASQDEPAKDAQLTIMGYDAHLEQALDDATGQPSIDVAVVRVEDPDLVELAITGAKLDSVELADPQATAVIRPRSFATEPACYARATHGRVPALY